MSQISWVDKVVKKGSIPIHLVRGKNAAGQDVWHFILCSYEKARMIGDNHGAESVGSGTFELKDFGEVIASGFGAEPDAATKAMLKEKYNFDIDALV